MLAGQEFLPLRQVVDLIEEPKVNNRDTLTSSLLKNLLMIFLFHTNNSVNLFHHKFSGLFTLFLLPYMVYSGRDFSRKDKIIQKVGKC
jgi:hypothetical protein